MSRACASSWVKIELISRVAMSEQSKQLSQQRSGCSPDCVAMELKEKHWPRGFAHDPPLLSVDLWLHQFRERHMNDFVNLCRIDSLLGSLREESKHRHDVVPLRHRSQVIQLAERLDQLRQQADLFVSLAGCSGKGVFPRFGSTTGKADLARMTSLA